MHSLARNHSFVDGKKRTAWVGKGLFVELNGFGLTASNDQSPQFTQQVAIGATEPGDMAACLRMLSRAAGIG